MKRQILFISDGTGITAETLGHSLMTQFPAVEFEEKRYAFIDTLEKAEQLRQALSQQDESRLILLTVADEAIRKVLLELPGQVLDIFTFAISWMSRALGQAPEQHVGHAHGMVDPKAYQRRIDAINYALSFDDGLGRDYAEADVILVGVSRSGKTPTCLYLALHFGLKAANYPLTENDFDSMGLPAMLAPWKDKLFGLSIDPFRLAQIREARKPGSSYARLNTCRMEVQYAERLFKRFRIHDPNTTETSIEEISTRILAVLKLENPLY